MTAVICHPLHYTYLSRLGNTVDVESRTVEYSFEDARLLVKGALELVDGVETYYEERPGVVTAKTGFRFGLLTSSYGETLTVTLREVDEITTEVSVAGAKNVDLNVGANPDKYVLSFLQTLDTLTDYPLADAVDVVDEHTRSGTKEVSDPGEQADGTNVLALVLVAVLVFSLFTILAL